MTDPVALKEYLERLLEAQRVEFMTALRGLSEQVRADSNNQDRAATLALANMERAVNKAEIAVDRRLEAMNEVRQTLNDQASTFLPRIEYSARHDPLDNRVQALEKFRAETSAKSETIGSAGGFIFSLVIAGAAVMGLIISLFFKGH